MDTVVAAGVIGIDMNAIAFAVGETNNTKTEILIEGNANKVYAWAYGTATADAYACCGEYTFVFVDTIGDGTRKLVRVNKVEGWSGNEIDGYHANSTTTVLVIGLTDDHPAVNAGTRHFQLLGLHIRILNNLHDSLLSLS